MILPAMKTPPADPASAVTSKYTEAYNLNVRICVNAQMAQQNLYEVCKGLKEMRDGKLYKELGYQNFSDYCEEEVGIKRHQAMKYAAIAELKNVESTQHFGTEKLYLLTKLDEPQREEIQQTTDLESVSVRELKKQIEELKTKADKADMLSKNLDDIKSENNRLAHNAKVAQSKIEDLESQILTLESRPVEVAVHESHEVENLQKAMRELNRQTEEQIAEITNENTQHIISLNRKHKEEMDELRSDYEKRLAEIPQAETVPDTKEVFKAHFTTVADAVNRLFMFVSIHNDAVFREKTKALFAQVDAELNKLEN